MMPFNNGIIAITNANGNRASLWIHLRRKFTGEYQLTKSQDKINQCAWTTSNCLPKIKKEFKTLIQAVRIYNQNMGWNLAKKSVKLKTTNDRKNRTTK